MEGIQHNLQYAQLIAEDYDILALQEHWTHGYEKAHLQSFFPDHVIASKHADQDTDKYNLETPRRKGGIAFVWKKELDDRIDLVYEGNSRIQAIQLSTSQNEKIIIVNTYMPTNGSENHIQKYQEILEEIRELLVKYSKYHFIWLGDLNGSLLRSTYAHDKILRSFIHEMELSPAGECDDMTFHHFNNKSHSQIDYIMVDKGLLDRCHNYIVRSQEASNVSSHDPVQVSISIATQNTSKGRKKIPDVTPRPKWEAVNLEVYQDLTHTFLEKLGEDAERLPLEQLIDDLENALKTAVNLAAPPRRKTNKRRKKPWTPKMTWVLRELKYIYWKWKSEGRPRGDSPTLHRLRTLKKQLRQEQRQQAAKQRLQEQDSIMRARENDHIVFNRLISKHKDGNDNLPDELTIDGQLVAGEDLLPALCQYFESLATPKTLPQYDEDVKIREDFKNEQLIRHYSDNPTRILPTVTPQMILEIIRDLKRGKAPDPTGLMAEHLHNASPLVTKVIATIMNKIIQSQTIPEVLKHGRITPVFKRKNTPKNIDNYRRITITMLLNKVLEKILQTPLKQTLSPQLCNLQRGFTEGASSTNTALLLSEAVAEATDKKSPLFTLYLDASKCFDVVYQNPMLNHLHDQRIVGDLWMLLNDNYKGMTSDVKWKGQVSRKFNEGQGIRQGGSNSSHVFNGKANPFLERMEKSGIGNHIGSIYVGTPTCADDVALIADNITDLQTMANLAYAESSRERFQYSITKSKAMIFTKTNRKDFLTYPIKMDQAEVEYSEEETHLGLVRTPGNKASDAVQDRIQKARGATYLYLRYGLQSFNGLHPNTALHIVNTRIAPILVYGFEVLDIRERDILSLETFMRAMLKRVQNLPNETANCATHILLGTLPVEAKLDSQVMGLFTRILHLQTSREKAIVLRQLSLKDLNSASWTQRVRRTLRKYNLPTPYDLLENPPTKEKWRKTVTVAIHKYWRDKISTEASTKSTLKYLNCDSYVPGQLHHLWASTEPNHLDIKKSQLKARILVGRYNLQTNLAKFKNSSPTCDLCLKEDEDLTHFLLRCPKLQHTRPGYLRQLKDLLTVALGSAETDKLMDDRTKLVQVIMDMSKILCTQTYPKETIRAIETMSRNLCYALHSARATLL